MINEALDTKPAFRPFHVLVRGGHLARFRGRVASIAPSLSVMAMAAVLLPGGVDQAAAQAGPTCEGGIGGQKTVELLAGAGGGWVCVTDHPDRSSESSWVDTSGSRFTVRFGLGAATAQMHEGTVVTDEARAHGLFASTTESGAATAQMEEGTVTTDGVGAHGIWVVSVGDCRYGCGH